MTKLTSLALDLSMIISRILSSQALHEIERHQDLHRQALVLDVTAPDAANAASLFTSGSFFAQGMQSMMSILQAYQSVRPIKKHTMSMSLWITNVSVTVGFG